MSKEKKYKIKIIDKDGKPIKSIFDELDKMTDEEKVLYIRKQEGKTIKELFQKIKESNEKYPALKQLRQEHSGKDFFQLFDYVVGEYVKKKFAYSLKGKNKAFKEWSYKDQVIFIEKSILEVSEKKENTLNIDGIDISKNEIIIMFSQWLEAKRAYLKNISHVIDINKEKKTKLKEPATSFDGNLTETQLQKLFNELISDKNEFIHSITTFEQFRAIFEANPTEAIIPVRWLKSNRLLAYFFNCLFLNHFINNEYWQSVIEKNKFFLNRNKKNITANDLAVAKSNYEDFNNPIGHNKIDAIIDNVKSIKP